jgi:putative SOS response-associated peptidase YedK
MCNLYRVRTAHDEVARYFGAASTASNTPEEVYPGTPGLVVTEEGGARSLRSMTWGFPLRLKGMKPEAKPKPVNNIADLAKPMWIGLARKPQWRCLIPVTEFAEAEGEKGRMTRTWFRVQGEPIFAWAGLWRVSDEWGPVYSGVMTDANEAIAPVHDRMPVLLHRDEYERWLHGDFDEAVAFQSRVFPSDLIEMEKTADLWVKKKAPSNPPSSLL